MTPPPTLQELIDTVRRDAGTDDPIAQLAVASATASDLEQTTDALLGHFVDRCRRAGSSWSQISAALGVTKQAVHKRFAGPLAERLVGTTGAPAFERFTLRARNVLAAAAATADDTGQRAIGTGHLLLGLFTEPDGVAARALADAQIDRDEVARALRAAWAQPAGADDVMPRPAGPPDSADPATLPTGDLAGADVGAGVGADAAGAARKPLSAAGYAALVNAVAAALDLRHNYIGTEHILLGLYRDPDSLAARVLAAAGGEPSEMQVRVAELLRGYAKP